MEDLTKKNHIVGNLPLGKLAVMRYQIYHGNIRREELCGGFRPGSCPNPCT